MGKRKPKEVCAITQIMNSKKITKDEKVQIFKLIFGVKNCPKVEVHI